MLCSYVLMNYTCLLVFSPFSTYFYPPMDEGLEGTSRNHITRHFIGHRVLLLNLYIGCQDVPMYAQCVQLLQN